jgi:hypothetical protein
MIGSCLAQPPAETSRGDQSAARPIGARPNLDRSHRPSARRSRRRVSAAGEISPRGKLSPQTRWCQLLGNSISGRPVAAPLDPREGVPAARPRRRCWAPSRVRPRCRRANHCRLRRGLGWAALQVRPRLRRRRCWAPSRVRPRCRRLRRRTDLSAGPEADLETGPGCRRRCCRPRRPWLAGDRRWLSRRHRRLAPPQPVSRLSSGLAWAAGRAGIPAGPPTGPSRAGRGRSGRSSPRRDPGRQGRVGRSRVAAMASASS